MGTEIVALTVSSDTVRLPNVTEAAPAVLFRRNASVSCWVAGPGRLQVEHSKPRLWRQVRDGHHRECRRDTLGLGSALNLPALRRLQTEPKTSPCGNPPPPRCQGRGSSVPLLCRRSSRSVAAPPRLVSDLGPGSAARSLQADGRQRREEAPRCVRARGLRGGEGQPGRASVPARVSRGPRGNISALSEAP